MPQELLTSPIELIVCVCFFYMPIQAIQAHETFIDPWGMGPMGHLMSPVDPPMAAQERSKLREGELSAIDKAVDLLSSEEVGRTQGPVSAGTLGTVIKKTHEKWRFQWELNQ